MRRILDDGREDGIATIFHSDGETITLEDVQDVEPIIEANKLLYNDVDERAPYAGDGFHRVASIPAVVMLDLERQGIVNNAWAVKDQKRFLQWLDDNSNIYFRTRPGKLSR